MNMLESELNKSYIPDHRRMVCRLTVPYHGSAEGPRPVEMSISVQKNAQTAGEQCAPVVVNSSERPAYLMDDWIPLRV